MADNQFPPVRLRDPGESPHGSDNFQRIPTTPRVLPMASAPRAPMFPQSMQVSQAAPVVPIAARLNVNDPHHYCNSITGNFLGATLDPFLLIQKNDVRRNLLGFRNTAAGGGANLFIDFGKPPSNQSWLVLAPGALVLLDEGVPQDDVWAVGDAAPWSVAFIYSTIPNNA